ncbi:ABC transporter permease [Candidatus Protochlamydia phocaeensis]|uniref:ABC transporter permease n=1 Tax=Candidatus Protochlamydia phocaeensis TaxID=1414722 RepID=UPI0008382C36
MLAYAFRKFAYFFCSLWIIATLTFILMKSVPGDPFAEEQVLRNDMQEALSQHYGLNDPWPVQYKNYMRSLLQGDLGYSLKYPGQSVNRIIQEGFPVSALLGLEAFFWAISIGIALGTLAALQAGKWQETAVLCVTTIGVSVPSFILAALLQYTLALKLGLFPLARWGTFAQTLLPSLALAALPLAFVARLTRASLIEVLQTDYIKIARAKGLSFFALIKSHALRNALLPVLSYLGQLMANILVGSFVIEKIFSIPGLGQWFVNSVVNRDYSLIMGLTLFYSVILMTSLFCVDMAYGLLDPRIRLLKRED